MKNKVTIVLAAVAAAFATLTVVGLIKKPSSVYEREPEARNPFEGKRVRFVENLDDPINADGVRGHLEAVSPSSHRSYIGTSEAVRGSMGGCDDRENESDEQPITRNITFYEKYTKRALDIFLSGIGLILLSPVYAVIAVWIYLDDPGPVLFTQKRVGKDKQYFKLHKFRSMKMSTPANTPTHMLEHPEQYITRSGRFIRKHSLDELPQIWDIWLGNMSFIGPRPALWNQDWLTACRNEYGSSNDIKPGLTGWAQINGRDELEIEDKAGFDNEYVVALQKSNMSGFLMDCKCFFGTIKLILYHDGVVEGGTGSHTQDKD